MMIVGLANEWIGSTDYTANQSALANSTPVRVTASTKSSENVRRNDWQCTKADRFGYRLNRFISICEYQSAVGSVHSSGIDKPLERRGQRMTKAHWRCSVPGFVSQPTVTSHASVRLTILHHPRNKHGWHSWSRHEGVRASLATGPAKTRAAGSPERSKT